MDEYLYRQNLNRLEYCPDTVKVFEVWKFENDLPVTRSRTLNGASEDFVSWLNQASPRSNNRAPVAGLRLIINEIWDSNQQDARESPIETLALSKESLQALMSSWRLSKYLPKAMLEKSLHYFARVSPIQNGQHGLLQAYILKTMTRSADSCTIAMSFDPETSTTCAFYCGVMAPYDLHQLQLMLSNLSSLLDSPMLLPIVITQLRYEPGEINMDRAYRALLKIEPKTGYHPFGNIEKDIDEPADLDTIPIIRTMQRATLLTTMVEVRQKALLLILDSVDAELAQEATTETVLKLRQHSSFVRTQMQNNLLRAEHLQKRCSTQLTVLYNLNAQHDLALNIQIARDSRNIAAASKADSSAMRTISFAAKRDSSAMKSIAWVTLFFLPGTFVSTMFAMPLFHWEDDGEPIATPRLLIYFAVTLPLTAITIFFWLRFEGQEKISATKRTRRQDTLLNMELVSQQRLLSGTVT